MLRAQLQLLSALHEQCEASEHQLHLVLEQFSLHDQHLLERFSSQDLTPSQLIAQYDERSQEGFQLAHYMPLLMLARELHVPVWGGFPPRTWARDMFRSGLPVVQALEALRHSHPVPRFTAWDSVTRISSAHSAYLSSLFHPETAPPPPSLHLPPLETQGFRPAQALKDAYLAHVAACVLERNNTVALVICGLGHCEYGLGAPERTVDMLKNKGLNHIHPLVVAAKPNDSGIWLYPDRNRNRNRNRSVHPPKHSGWSDEPTRRSIADAVLLYDWKDDHPEPEPEQAQDQEAEPTQQQSHDTSWQHVD